MRKITQQSVNAFFAHSNMSMGNMTVTNNKLLAVVQMRLHGNAIAKITGNEVWITNAGWFTNTTKERLNGILDYLSLPRIYQKDFVWYLNDKPWNGGWTQVADYV